MSQYKSLGAIAGGYVQMAFSFPKGDRERIKTAWAKAQEICHDWLEISRCARNWYVLTQTDRWEDQVIREQVANVLMLQVATRKDLMVISIKSGCTTGAIINTVAEDMCDYRSHSVLHVSTVSHGDELYDIAGATTASRSGSLPDEVCRFIRGVDTELWKLFPHGSVARIPKLGDVKGISIVVRHGVEESV